MTIGSRCGRASTSSCECSRPTDGESAAGKVAAAVAAKAEPIRQLAYHLYTLCERAGRAEDARTYNELITSWSPIESAAAATTSTAPAQKTLFE